MNNWEDVEDPAGRLKKDQIVRWNGAEPGRCDMKIIRLYAPMGLYSRPIRETDSPAIREMTKHVGNRLPCDQDDPDALYRPENLFVYFRYLHDGSESNGLAINITVVE